MQLNIEQKKLIQAKPNGQILIKGVAGSGKTTVAVNRIPFLLNNYCFQKEDCILAVTFNKTLVNYIEYLYEKVDQEDQMSFKEIMNASENKVDIQTIDSIMYKYFMNFKKKKKLEYEVLYNNKEKINILSESIAQMKKEYPKVKILDQKKTLFMLDEIDWIKSCDYMEKEEYQNIDRLGRMSNKGKEGPQRLNKRSDSRAAIFEVMLLYNEKLKEKGYIDFKDMALLALEEAKNGVQKKYTHILIDESQDLTRVQIEFLKLLYHPKEYGSFCFIADTAQSIYPHSWFVKGRSFTSIGFDMTGKSNSLSKNYRTTTQIAQAAYSLIEKDPNIVEDENYVKPALMDKKGEYPVYKWTKNPQEEAEYIKNEIKNNLLSTYQAKEIAIIARNKNQLEYMEGYLKNQGIKCSILNKTNPKFEEDEIKLLTMHSIKGLEFKVVMIIGLNKGKIPFVSYQGMEDLEMQETSDRKLFYVGMTRATELLYLSNSSKPSKFIYELEPSYLKIRQNTKMKKFFSIKLDEYLFQERIIDLYSNEERVRQWVISELIHTYKYPMSLIDVEYKVNNFSNPGFVDIVVNIYKKNTKIPYIFIETKAAFGGINGGLDQLKSYMSNSQTCQYGIVTDGNELRMINKGFEEIQDIPQFHSSMIPSSIEEYTYVDLKHNKNYELLRDPSDYKELVIRDQQQNTDYKAEKLEELYMYGEIVAGIPKLASEEIGNSFHLPTEWVQNKEDCFLLKVTGDSMEGANIQDGDYVVIKKQNTAENMDLVAATIDENATLKKFMSMGDTILLIPENKKYEPIQMKSNQVYINGVVIGILKRG
ncbi:MAG: transcriptional repressor LexA [Marinisporobacter sp.]|jgi:SOS regulatory protein LexA|nr:transcriptional repressor LexA [Marinisporobacter sp.]